MLIDKTILIALLVTGCAIDPPAPQQYTCTVLYRCVNAETISARVATTCAGDIDEAEDTATDLMIAAMPEACPGGWQYVRPLCEAQGDECRRAE